MSFDARGRCPVAAYDRAGEGYAESVGEWLANPHAFFKAFGPEARAFQARHRSERLRTMTLVAPAEELAELRPVCLSVDDAAVPATSWEEVFALTTARLLAANPLTFAAMQRDGLLEWLGCPADGAAVAAKLAANTLDPTFGSMAEVVLRVQWLVLMCGIRLNEVIVQADPYTDEQWAVRKAALDRRRAEDKAFMEGRRAAQKAWAEAHPEETPSAAAPRASRWSE